MSFIKFESPKDGSVLTFSVIRRWSEEVEFEVVVRSRSFSGAATGCTSISGSPSAMFREMANEWKGWRGEKAWKDIEGRVALTATSDSTGHTSLAVELIGDDYDRRLYAVLLFEAGQLEGMANEISALLG